jgi:dihydrofolate synthase/folylpolyglutamate synthase
VASVLAAHDLTAGYFISPHLERVEERIGVGNRHATPEEFAQAVTDVAAFADIYESRETSRLTYFELTAAMAFAWFAEIAANVAAVEVGLGGRLDATNTVHGDVSVITSIGLDHTEFLGDTIEKVATEKLGIVKPGTKLVTGPLPASVESLVAEVASERGVVHYAYGRDFQLESATPAVGGFLCSVSGIEAEYEDVFLPLLGRHQTVNFAVALAAGEALRGKALDPELVRVGAAGVRSPGRLEPIASHPLIVLDGAHNSQGFETLGRALIESFDVQSWVLLMGAMKDKNTEEMLSFLRGKVIAGVATSTGTERAMTATELRTTMADVLDVEVVAEDDPSAAVETAKALAGADGAVIVAGSLYLVGAVRSFLTGAGSPQKNER